jgi:hypothetical protein
MYNAATALDQVAQGQANHAATVNSIFAALSASAIFGIKASATRGLTLVLYGGNFPVSGTPTVIADQTVTLTASTTNYIYATSAGVVTKTTSAPTGWPGPLAAGATALYDLTTNASGIVSGNNWRIGIGGPGPTGNTGASGNPGLDMPAMRLRFTNWIGNNNTTVHNFGWSPQTLTGTVTGRAVGTGSLRASIPYTSYVSSATAGSSIQLHRSPEWCYLGNAAGRGGFTLAIRFCVENSALATPANMRSFIGLFTPGTIGNVEPDTILNMVGIGAKAGDANFSFMHNDGSGSATVVSLGSNFPARATDNVYELLLTSVANSGTVTCTLTDVATGNRSTNSASSDLPSNTTFLTDVVWANNGSTASACSLGLMQIVGETRY